MPLKLSKALPSSSCGWLERLVAKGLEPTPVGGIEEVFLSKRRKTTAPRHDLSKELDASFGSRQLSVICCLSPLANTA